MPVIGWSTGRTVEQWIVDWDHWAAFGLLAFIGFRAVYVALAEREAKWASGDPTRGLQLVMYSTATSIDALAVGLTFAMLNVRLWYPCLVIGLIASAFTIAGMLLGSRLGMRFGRRIEILGGLILVGIGVRILFQHLMQ